MNTNKPKSSNGVIEVNRVQIEHRAGWMALFYDEAEKAGADAETITRNAVRRMGGVHGDFLKKTMKEPGNSSEFREVLFTNLISRTFEMDNIISSDREVSSEFNYCPLLTAWRRMGFSEERNAKLCDIAMEGDRGIAEAMGYQMELNGTIATGNSCCKVRFYKDD